MQNSMQAVSEKIEKLLEAGVFSSEEQAIESILAWLQQMEDDFILQQMQQEDA